MSKESDVASSAERPREIEVPTSDYQPSRAELREEVDMPGARVETIRRAFLCPVVVLRRPREK